MLLSFKPECPLYLGSPTFYLTHNFHQREAATEGSTVTYVNFARDCSSGKTQLCYSGN